MSERWQLQPTWAWASIGELTAEPVDQGGPGEGSEFVYIDISAVDNSSKRIVEPKVLHPSAAPSRARQRLRVGDVLVSMTRPNLNAVALVLSEFDGAICSTGFHVLRSTGVDPRWLYYAVQTRHFVEEMSKLVQGALYPAVRPKDIRGYAIPVPPLAEQRRIIAALEEHLSDLNAAIVGLERGLINTRRYRSAVLSAALTGQLDQHAPRCESPSAYLDPAVEYPLPAGWRWLSVSELCEKIDNGNTPAASQMYPGVGEIPFIKVYNLTMTGHLDFTVKPTFIDRATHDGQLRRSRLLPGDVLTNIVGPPLGKVALVPPDLPEWNTNQAVVAFRTGPELLNRYLALALMAEPIIKRLSSKARATAGQFNISLTMCRSLRIPVPNVQRQHEIVAEVDRRLAIADRTAAEIDVQLARAARLRQSILKRAFEGKLVPQDPADEPASVLLDRIRTQHHTSRERRTRRRRSHPTHR